MVQFVEAKTWLQTKWHVLVPDDWLQACIEWIQEEYQNRTLSTEEVMEMIFVQWLCCDLRDIGARCLPPDLTNQNKQMLNGFFCLQINSIVDVSCSLYGQLQKVQGVDTSDIAATENENANNPTKVSSKRMLMMEMTDGSQNVEGMEYQTIACLNTDITPGTKVLLQGEIMSRLGVLMLRTENVTLLGGEVETLLQENKQELVIRRLLEFNMNLNQQSKENAADPSTTGSVEVNNPRRGRKKAATKGTTQTRPTGGSRSGVLATSAVQNDDKWDDDFVYSEAVLQQLDNEVLLSQSSVATPAQTSVVNIASSVSASGYDGVSTESAVVKRPRIDRRVGVTETMSSTACSSSVKTPDRRAPVINESPFVYLSNVLQWQTQSRRVAEFSVKAYISTLTSGLDHCQGTRWRLTAKINDGTAAVDVEFSDTMLADLIGYSAQHFVEMKERARRDVRIKSQVMESIKRCQQKLIQMSAILLLLLTPDDKVPVVQSYRAVTSADIAALQQRITSRR